MKRLFREVEREKYNIICHELREDSFKKQKVVNVKCYKIHEVCEKILNSTIMKFLVILESNTSGMVYDILRDH